MAVGERQCLEIIEEISGLLEKERCLLKAEAVDWEELEHNLNRIGELFGLLPFQKDSPPHTVTEQEQPDQDLTVRLSAIALLRRENMEILRSTTEDLGRQITSLKLGKKATLAYTDYQLPTNPPPDMPEL